MTEVTFIRCDAPKCKSKVSKASAQAWTKWKLNTTRSITGAWTGTAVAVRADYCPKHKASRGA